MGIQDFCIDSDSEIKITGLQDQDGVEINDATVTASLFKQTTLNIDACRLDFTSGGVATPVVGDIIVGATSTAWAEIVTIILQSGTWAGGDAAGYFTLKGQQGTFVGENLDQHDGQANIATIAADSTGAITANGGAKTKLLVKGHGLFAYEVFCRVEGSQNYNGQQVISAWEKHSITINKAYTAEKFIGDEVIYIGIVGGKDIVLTATGSDGIYKGTLPDTLKGIVNQDAFYLIIKIVKGASIVFVRLTWRAEFKTDTDVVVA